MDTTHLPVVHADACRWTTLEQGAATPRHPHQLTFLSPFPNALTGLEKPSLNPGAERVEARKRMRRSFAQKITAADVADFEAPADTRHPLRNRSGAFLPPLYVRTATDSEHAQIVQPADADTIIESAEALLAHRCRRGVKILRDPWLLLRFIQIRLVSQTRPVFAVFFLDRAQRLIHFAELFHGEDNRIKVYPKEVVREALAWNAEQILCVRSDPAGDHQPTSEDLVDAGRIKRAMDLLNIELLDYVVVGKSLTSLRMRRAI